MTNSVDPDQLASSEASWSGSTLFAKTGYIPVQQDKSFIHVVLKKAQTSKSSSETERQAV